jgi:hypothetical protein
VLSGCVVFIRIPYQLHPPPVVGVWPDECSAKVKLAFVKTDVR